MVSMDVETTASVREILLRKGTEVETIPASATVLEAIQRMLNSKLCCEIDKTLVLILLPAIQTTAGVVPVRTVRTA